MEFKYINYNLVISIRKIKKTTKEFQMFQIVVKY